MRGSKKLAAISLSGLLAAVERFQAQRQGQVQRAVVRLQAQRFGQVCGGLGVPVLVGQGRFEARERTLEPVTQAPRVGARQLADPVERGAPLPDLRVGREPLHGRRAVRLFHLLAERHRLRPRGHEPSLTPMLALTAGGMNAVNAVILDKMQSQIPLIPALAGHLISGGGKRMRPALVLALAIDDRLQPPLERLPPPVASAAAASPLEEELADARACSSSARRSSGSPAARRAWAYASSSRRASANRSAWMHFSAKLSP